ncbi:AN1-type zinc finger domain-containing protein [Halorubrum sp. N11]|uniref:AN1-type zinc finger domain-containing protein n=1 Tax=Halorubrum sp. N11 TaxID=3402276 RepID=UPI003EBA637D
MSLCDNCGSDLKGLDYNCSRCGGTFCTKCRLPESHDCIGLKVEKAERELKREAGDSQAWFKNDEAPTQQNNRSSTRQVSNNSTLLFLLIFLAIILIAGSVIAVL